MFKQYFKQAISSLRENPLISFLIILGTALSVSLLLVLTLLYQVRTASYPPVSNKDRLMSVNIIEAAKINEDSRWHGGLAYRIVDAAFYPMDTPAGITAMSSDTQQRWTTTQGYKGAFDSEVLLVDGAFWRVFDFTFSQGKPFTDDDFRAARAYAVVNEDIALRMFGTTDVVGQTIQLDHVDFTIRGVVKPVSKAATEAYGEIWIPYSLDKSIMMTENTAEGICSMLNVYFLAESANDFKAIRQEAQRRITSFNAGQKEWTANIWGQPVNNFQRMFYFVQGDRFNGQFYGMLTLGILFFLLPTLNLMGITFSQIRKRQPEIGLRKAFGARTRTIVGQILCENFIITIIGGCIGLVMSLIFFYIAKDSLLEGTGMKLSLEMLVQPTLFLAVLLFCLLINLCSAGIPAWRISKAQIVDSINMNEQNN